MKMPKMFSTKNILIGSGIVSALSGIATVACAITGVDADEQPCCNCGSAADAVAPADDDVTDAQG